MEQVEIKTLSRESFGKEAAKKIREQGLVPVVLYSKGSESQSMMVKENELIKCLNTESGTHVIFTLITDKGKDTAIIHEIDKHPLTHRIRHVDFMHIDLKQEIETEIDVRLAGTAPGVKQGGELLQRVKRFRIKCLPENLPKHFEVDITGINLGEVLRVADIHLENVSITYPKPETVVASVDKPKGMESQAELDAAAQASAAASAAAKTEK